MIVEIILCGAAGGLLSRCLFWHVPKLGSMIWQAWKRLERCEACSGPPCPCLPGAVALPKPAFDHDAHERALFAAVPSAFWLEPTRWTRPTWPAKPTEDDLAWDKSTDDLLLAHASLDDVWRARFKHNMEEQAWLGGRRRPSSAPPPISSTRRFDRRY